MDKLRIGITHGDPNGVGYEVILKAFADPALLELCTPIVYGSIKVASYHRKTLDLPTNFNAIAHATEAHDAALNLIHCTADEVKIDLGQSTPEAGTAALAALERAVADWQAGLIDAIVTAPICKHSIQSEQFAFPGHTEYLANAVGHDGQEPLMVLMNDALRVALVTTHLPLRKVADAISTETIVKRLRLFNASLMQDFDISQPRIAVLSLNPHAGDDGTLGTEESEVIAPALQQAADEGVIAYGPFAADGFFGAQTYTHYDGVLAMYHDQGLAPFKLLAMDDGVNFTAGLDLVRTSPDHGTAFDIAGKGVASEASFRQALYAAIDITRRRRAFKERHADPLPKLYVDKRERGQRNQTA